MSYCRWSSDDWTCDVYVYEAVWGGWSTNVAANRRVPKEPLPPEVPYPPDRPPQEEGPEWEEWHSRFQAWYLRYKDVNRIVREGDLVPIDLPHAGKSFGDDTPGECADRLEDLKALGFVVPQYAIDQLRAEEAAGYTGYEEE